MITKQLISSLFLLIILVVNVQQGESLKCYVCTTTDEKHDCWEHPEKTSEVECGASSEVTPTTTAATTPTEAATTPTTEAATTPTTGAATTPTGAATTPTGAATTPTTAPTTPPTMAPTTPSTTAPTTPPTMAPTTPPTMAPTTPSTTAPTTPPTMAPTTPPTMAPTTPPTMAPTTPPTMAPTTPPTMAPTTPPTMAPAANLEPNILATIPEFRKLAETLFSFFEGFKKNLNQPNVTRSKRDTTSEWECAKIITKDKDQKQIERSCVKKTAETCKTQSSDRVCALCSDKDLCNSASNIKLQLIPAFLSVFLALFFSSQ